MRWFGRRVLSRLEEAQIMAAGVEVARPRRDNKVLLDDIADLRGLYDVCLRDCTGTERPQSQVTAAHMSHTTG